MNDPKVAVDTILDSDFEIDGLKIYPITLGRYALLELLQSPFLYSDVKFSVSNVLPSLYVMANDIKTLSKFNSGNIENLKSESMIWSEEKELKNIDCIIDSIIKRFRQLNEVSPQTSDDDKKKA